MDSKVFNTNSNGNGKQLRNVWAELGQAGDSIRTFSKMTAENPMLHASHCHQIYCELLRIWHIKFKP